MTAFVGEFHWNGSTDVITALTIKPGAQCLYLRLVSLMHVTTALDFRASLGGEARIIEYCHTLAINGGNRLAQILQTEMMLSPGAHPEEIIPCMVSFLSLTRYKHPDTYQG